MKYFTKVNSGEDSCPYKPGLRTESTIGVDEDDEMTEKEFTMNVNGLYFIKASCCGFLIPRAYKITKKISYSVPTALLNEDNIVCNDSELYSEEPIDIPKNISFTILKCNQCGKHNVPATLVDPVSLGKIMQSNS